MAVKRNAFCHKTSPVLPQNAFHFDTKRLPFWYKTHSVSIRNAPRFATKRNDTFCHKTRNKCAILYAYELLYRGDAKAADAYKQQLHQRRQHYAIPGETITAISLIEAIDAQACPQA